MKRCGRCGEVRPGDFAIYQAVSESEDFDTWCWLLGEIRQALEPITPDHHIVSVAETKATLELEAHPRYQPLTQAVLVGVQAGQQQAITSVVTVMELTVQPWRLGRAAVAREYEALLVHFPNLTLADVTRDAARRAAQLRARYNVRPADALQVATTLVHRATVFVTNDQRLARLSPEVDVIALDDFMVAILALLICLDSRTK